jgi:hypothetical protein
MNEASLTICRMVWAELKLGKMVDWRTLLELQSDSKHDPRMNKLHFH